MNRLDRIIKEEIDRVIISEASLDSLKNIFQDFVDNKGKKSKDSKKKTKSKEEERKEKKERKKKSKKAKGSKKVRMTVNGGREYYDYDEYQRKNRKSSKTDADAIRNMIDQENTDIAAVAREVFPNHTDEGAQSQLRKILNGERPMTKRVASILMKLISAGRIAVK